MKTSLCAACCALLILWSPSFGQDHTIELQSLIDDPAAPVNQQGLREVTIPNDRPAWITGPIRLPGNLRLTLEAELIRDSHWFSMKLYTPCAR